MSQAPPGRIVEFSASLKPSGRMSVNAARTPAEPGGTQELHRGTKGGLMIMRILAMTREDRIAAVTERIEDPMVVWFALLAPHERRQFINAAQNELARQLGVEQQQAEDAGEDPVAATKVPTIVISGG